MRIFLFILVFAMGFGTQPHLTGGGDVVPFKVAAADDDDDGDGGDDGDDAGDGGDDGDDGGEDSGSGGDDDGEENDEDDDDEEEEEHGAASGSSGSGGLVGLIESIFGGDSGADFVDNEIVAIGTSGLAPQEISGLRAAGFAVISQDRLTSLGAVVVRLSVPSGVDAEEALAVARGLAPNASFDLNHLYGPTGESCSSGNCWSRYLTGMANLEPTACRRGAPIAIIDSPIETDHPALRGANVETRSFLPDGVFSATSDHGTAIAALLVGEGTSGSKPLAPGARLLAAGALRIIDGRTQADVVSIVRSIDWAVSRRARVIAMSFEGASNTLLAFAVQTGSRRANLVAAAGNSGPHGAAAYPAAYPEVIAVAAVDKRMRPYRSGTRGTYVEIAAPGVGILSAGPDGTAKEWTGSSFAVPYVAAALLRARAETRGDAMKARTLLNRMAMDLGPPGRDEVYGYGLLQVPAARCW